MINAFTTFARFNGFAVLVWTYGASVSVVRYIGIEGKKITEGNFEVNTRELTAF